MYFAYGWPKALAVGDAGFKQDIVSLSLDSEFCLIVFTGSAQLWAGGQHRVRLGKLDRSEDSIKAEGLNKRAYWCSSRRMLAVLVNMQQVLQALQLGRSVVGPVNTRAFVCRHTTTICTSMECIPAKSPYCKELACKT